ncbi:MAG: transcription elongation factor GreA [Planctomycetota bacterium]
MEFLTAEDKTKLEERLAYLKANRIKVSEKIAEAREHGDLKENTEYHAMRETQGMEEAEIKRLEERLASAQIADDADVPEGMVFLGSVVRLKDLDDESDDLYKLVGAASGNFDADEIEVTANSPMGEALMKARVGETVKVDLPKGPKRFEILELL